MLFIFGWCLSKLFTLFDVLCEVSQQPIRTKREQTIINHCLFSHYFSVETEPSGFHGDVLVKGNLNVTYTATDYSGNTAECVVVILLAGYCVAS